MLVPHVLDVVRQAPQRPDQVGVEDADVQGRPGWRPAGGYSGSELDRVGIGDQVQLAGVARRQQERGADGAGELGQGGFETIGDATDDGADGSLTGERRNRDARHDTVDRVDLRAERARVDQQAQSEVPGPGPVAGPVPVGLALQVRGVPVVTVGDQRRAGQQVLGDSLVDRLVGDRPQPVAQPVREHLVDEQSGTERAGVHRGDGGAGGPTTVVDQEDRLEVGLDRGVEREPIADRPGHRVLVGQDDVVFRRAEPERPEQTALDVAGPAVRVGRRLLVDVERRRLVGHQDARLTPGAEQGSRAVVAALTCRDVVAWEDEAYDVVFVGLLERDHPVGVDDVVRRGGQRGQRSSGLGVVAKGTER